MSLSLSDFPVAMLEHTKRNEHRSGNGLPGCPFVVGWIVNARAFSYDDDAKAWLRAHGFPHRGRRWLRFDD
ncbi:hypothetical protein [Burkholderia gladioli]|uniref:hypothetical protein n=1 Tax=Burkholderia gladioli TaxID=28095 RepID=UPI001641A9CC|nr:hypothetical protein [Burkholderia gladioli]